MRLGELKNCQFTAKSGYYLEGFSFTERRISFDE